MSTLFLYHADILYRQVELVVKSSYEAVSIKSKICVSRKPSIYKKTTVSDCLTCPKQKINHETKMINDENVCVRAAVDEAATIKR